jgi:hypothetical protein
MDDDTEEKRVFNYTSKKWQLKRFLGICIGAKANPAWFSILSSSPKGTYKHNTGFFLKNSMAISV